MSCSPIVQEELDLRTELDNTADAFQVDMIPFLPSTPDAETLENTFRKLTNEKREREVMRTGPGL